MVYLTAAVVLVGALCLLDLVLTLGVVRRLREHARLISKGAARSSTRITAGLGVPPGEVVADFAATTTDGESVSRATLLRPTLVGFFAPGCPNCAEEMPEFIDFARSLPGREHVLAVISGGTVMETDYPERLGPLARVVLEDTTGPVQQAFQVSGYPTLFFVDEGGTVVAGAASMKDLKDLVLPTAVRAAVT